MKKTFFLCAALFVFSGFSYAQPRIIEKKYEKPGQPAIASETFKVKYEGGMFGFNTKQEGILKFDDANFRVVFFGKNGKELFSIPYKSIIVISPNSQSVQSTTGKVVQHTPLPGAGLAGMFIKEKRRYMVINFDDPDVNAKGLINFKLESREMLDSAIQTLGTKAEMQGRGDSYYRRVMTTAKDNQ